MKRTLMHIYAKDSLLAVETYQKAFDATLGFNVKNEDGSYYHSELDVYGQIISVVEIDVDEIIAGNTMQFCLHFNKDETDKVTKAYEVLKDGAKIIFPLGASDFSQYMVDLIDKFGVRWCIFVTDGE